MARKPAKLSVAEFEAAQNTPEQTLLREAKRRYSEASEAFNEFNRESREILDFLNGEQWDSQLKNNRMNAGLPCITVNVLPSYIRQITNESRQNCPSIQVDPKGSGASKEIAEIYADLTRAIEQHSVAETAYDTAGQLAASIGLGYIRVVSEFESPESFEQKLVIKQVDDTSAVLLDPNHKNLDGSDAEYAFILSTISKEEYKRSFPETKLGVELINNEEKVKPTGWSASTGANNQWIRDNDVIIAEYYYKDYVPKTLYQVFNTLTGETIESMEEPLPELLEDGTLIVVNSRPTHDVQIKWCKLNDKEILEETTWPGKHIPVVAIKGLEMWINGKRKLSGAVKGAIDSQRAFNYFTSVSAELVSLAPKAPWVGEIRQFANFEHLYRDSNVSAITYLPYNAVTENGQVLPPPMRQSAEPAIQAAVAMAQSAKANIEAVLGIFKSDMGATGPETSAKAIIARTGQAHTTNYNFYDNLSKGVAQVGRILVDAIPTFYHEAGREIQLIRQNGVSSNVRINSDDKSDIRTGNYGVVVETGPSYATRRQESVTSMMALGGADPQILPLIADLIVENSDFPGADRIAARLRTLLPPEIQQEEMSHGEGGSEQYAAQLSQQLKQQGQAMQQLTQQYQQADQLLHQAMAENKLLKDKTSLEVMKARQDNSVERDKLSLEESQSELEARIKLAELALERDQFEFEKTKFALEVAKTQNKMTGDLHDRTISHIDKIVEVSTPKIPEIPEVSDSGFNLGTIDVK